MDGAERVMVVSPQKAGTHLLQELMVALGYKMQGAVRLRAENAPQFDVTERWRIARLVLSATEVLELEHADDDEFVQRTDEAWRAYMWSWYRRLGQPVTSRYGADRFHLVDHLVTNDLLSRSTFADTPKGLCWTWHELDVDKMDGNFVNEWSDSSAPAMVLNYRDPRDCLVSLINFIEGKTAGGFGNFSERRIYHAILSSMSTMAEKLECALRDPSFPGRHEFARSLWLLQHPQVCKTRYEDLIGPRGGGSRERQVQAVTAVLDHLGSSARADQVADRLYNHGSWSFHRGQTGDWRDAFTSRTLRLFYEVHGDIVEQYGYR